VVNQRNNSFTFRWATSGLKKKKDKTNPNQKGYAKCPELE